MRVAESPRSFKAGSDLQPYRLTKLNTAAVVYNTSNSADDPIGSTETFASSGESIAVNLLSTDGTLEIEAVGAVPLGADVFAADNGMIQALPAAPGTYRHIGKALQVAPAGGGVIEIMPYNFYATKTVA